MNADTATQLVLVLLGAALVFALIGWAPYGRTIGPPLALLALGAAAVLASVSEELSTGRWTTTVLSGNRDTKAGTCGKTCLPLACLLSPVDRRSSTQHAK